MLLSDDELNKCALAQGFHLTYHLRDFARAIEAAILAEQGKLAEQAKADPMAWWCCLPGQDVVLLLEEPSDDRYPQGYKAPLYLHPAPAPKGMVMVPREPTEAMIKAGEEADDNCMTTSPAYAATDIYRAMIAASEKEHG